MIDWIRGLGRFGLGFHIPPGTFGGLFLGHALSGAFRCLPRFGLVVQQLYAIGVLTMLIILVSGLFVGMVLGLQGYYQLVNFSAESSLGLVVALFLVQGIGPGAGGAVVRREGRLGAYR